jgi:hypothetical protein
MKTVRFLIAVSTMIGAALAQGTPQTAVPVAPVVAHLGPAFTGDNIEALVGTMKTDSLPKSEFETTATYEARRNMNRKDGATMVFVLDDKQHFDYDADSEMMMTTIGVRKQIYLERGRVEYYPILDICHIERSHREYIGSNAYGAERKVSSNQWDEYGITINQPLESTLLVAMNTATAKDVKPFLRLGIACTLLKGALLQTVSGNEATIFNPHAYYINSSYLPVVVTEMFIFDKRDGTALLRVHSNSPDDIAMQRDFRKKTFPIELEFRGSGMLYARIDGGSEEPLSQNAIIRAKHQLNLRVEVSYDRLDLRLNEIAYRPAWSIHNLHAQIGTLSMFDYAEAVISSADFEEDSQSGTHSQIGPNRVGETFQEWLAINQIDLPVLCRESKNACKRLTGIQRSGHGEFSTTNKAHQVFNWLFVNGKVSEIR